MANSGAQSKVTPLHANASAAADTLQQKIAARTAVVSVIGLGYVGLPLMLGFAGAGFPVLGLDLDQDKLKNIRAKKTYIKHITDEMVKEILQSRTPEQLPLGTVRFSSPASGEGDVSVNRETIVHFTVPFSLGATLDTTKFHADFAGRKVLSRVEISSDRKKASLFYLEPLPANSRIKVTFDGTKKSDIRFSALYVQDAAK